MGNDRSSANQGTFANDYARQNDRSAANGCPPLYSRRYDLPVGLSLQPAILGCPRVQVIDEHDSVAHEYVVFDRDPFADESVRRNLAAFAYRRIFLHLDEGSDLGIVAHCASIKIDQIRLEDLHSVAQDYVG
jgi:hypothetical protein